MDRLLRGEREGNILSLGLAKDELTMHVERVTCTPAHLRMPEML